MTAQVPRSDGGRPVRARQSGDGVSTEEIAAVLAALTRRDDEGDTEYERWRAGRLAALHQKPRPD